MSGLRHHSVIASVLATLAAGAVLMAVSHTAAAHQDTEDPSAPTSRSTLARRVHEAVTAAVPPAGARIRVSEKDGVVVLAGSYPTLANREQAAFVAEQVEGVRHLEVQLTVQPTRRVSDAALKGEVDGALKWLPGLGGPAVIESSVMGGHVTLTGAVQRTEDLYQALGAVRAIDGVRSVQSSVEVNPTEGRRRMELQLEKVLAERRVEVKQLSVSQDGRRVTINGETHDVIARQVVDDYVKALPGGHEVTNQVRYVLGPSTPGR